jgi:hypothetical protein
VIPARALALAGIVVGSTQVLAALARLVRPAALVLSPVAALGAGVGLPLLLQGRCRRRGRQSRGGTALRRDRCGGLGGRCAAGSLVLPFDQVPGRPRTAHGEADHAGGRQPDPEALERTASSGGSGRECRDRQLLNEGVIRL